MAISFIFLAITQSPSTIYENINAIYYSLFGAVLFGLAFAIISQYFSKNTPHKKWPILVTLLSASSIWLLVPLLTRQLPQSVYVSLPSLLIGIGVLQKFSTSYANKFPTCSTSPQTNISELFFRFIFTGSVIALSVFFAKTLGPFWGAVIGGSYPASFSSQLMIFQSKYPTKFLPSLIKTLPIGVLSTTGYATIVALTYPTLGILMGTILAFFVSLVISLTTGKLSKEKNNSKHNQDNSTNT